MHGKEKVKIMVKKITAVLSALTLISAAIPATVGAEKAHVSEIIRYECDSITNKDNKKYILNAVDNDKYLLRVYYADWVQNGNYVKTYKVNDVTYAEKSYIDTWYTGEWQQNLMVVESDADLKTALTDGFSTDMWFKLDKNSYKFVLMNAGKGEDDAMFRVEYYSNGDGEGNGQIIITRKMKKGDNEIYGQYSCFKTLSWDTWHNISVSLDESSGINVPILLVDGATIVPTLGTLTGSEIQPTKNNGYVPASYAALNKITFGRAKERISDTSMNGGWVNGHIYFSQMSIYNGAKTEAELLESYEKNVGYYEPEYDVKITDGLGSEVAKSDLESVFAATGTMPKITIDTSKVENTDTAAFNSENITVTDLTDNKQLTANGTLNGSLYEITSNEYIPGHRYMLQIDNSVTQSRTKAQTLEFATVQSVPEAVARYNMDKYTVNDDQTTSIEDDIGNVTTRFGSTPVSVNKYDNTYYLPVVGWAPGLATSDNLKKALSDEFTLDIWFRKDSQSGNPEKRIWSFAATEGVMLMLAQQLGRLIFTVRYSYEEDGAAKEKVIAYQTTDNTNVFSDNGWNHLIFAYDSKTDTKRAVINGTERKFDTTPLHWGIYSQDTLPDGAKPCIRTDNAMVYVNGTAIASWSYGGFVSQYQIGAQTYYNKASSVAYMKYLSGLDNDRYDAAYDLTLIQGGKELERTDLTALAKGSLTAQIAIAKTNGLDKNVYIENAQGIKTVPSISWNNEGTLATLSFVGLTTGEYKLVIAKTATDSEGAAIRKTDYVLPMTVVGTTELSLLVNGAAVPEGTKVTGDAFASAELVNVDNAVLIAARYKDGKLVDVLTSDEKFGELNNQLGIYIEGITKGETVKLMLWNSLGEMNPVIAGAEY